MGYSLGDVNCNYEIKLLKLKANYNSSRSCTSIIGIVIAR